MDNQHESAGLLNRLNVWIRESVTLKLFSIGILVLLLLIPTAWIQSLIEERQQRAQSVVTEISETWSGDQVLVGPALVVPFTKRETVIDEKLVTRVQVREELAFFLPDELAVESNVAPTRLHRGIFEAAVYGSQNEMSARFDSIDFSGLGVSDSDVLWGKAYFILGVSDLRGVSATPVVRWGEQLLVGEPTDDIGISVRLFERPDALGEEWIAPADPAKGTFRKGIKIPASLSGPVAQQLTVSLDVKGSRSLHFIPVGKTTRVRVQGPWSSPSFVGNFLPTERNVGPAGFDANWQVLHYNRPFGQQWLGANRELSDVNFGVRLLIPAGQYQKSIRTAKYGILVILLSFVALLLVELITKIRIHAFQYILVGAALIVYYTLLLSLSEHISFNVSYLIASGCTTALVGLYVFAILKNSRITLLFGGLLTFFYLFIFVIIQLQDYSLLVGSIGLFVLVAALMYVSRKVNWYNT
jgi:inner membrane protein